jgi:microcystin-dependent protein
MSVWKWSLTAGSNDSADSTINLREGQAPSTVNNSVRAIMTAVKKWWLDLGGMIDTGGTSTAYTITTNQVISTLTDGARVAARMHATSGSAPTLAVDGTTAKSITVSPGVAPPSGSLISGTVQSFVYDAGNDEWRVAGYVLIDGTPRTGAKMDTILEGPYPGWVMAAGKTIGNASSGGTERANADTQALFIGWHKATASQNALYPIQDSSGGASTRTTAGTADENALTDFNANKRLPLPNLRSRAFVGLDNMGGTSANTITDAAADILGGTLGTATHTLVSGEVPQLTGSTNTTGAHTHTVNYRDETRSVEAGVNLSNMWRGTTGSNTGSAGDHSHTVTVNSGGGGAHNNLQPSFFGYVWIKL